MNYALIKSERRYNTYIKFATFLPKNTSAYVVSYIVLICDIKKLKTITKNQTIRYCTARSDTILSLLKQTKSRLSVHFYHLFFNKK